MRVVLTLSALALMGCSKKREPAPDALEEIAAFMFRHWEDEATMEGAMQNLAPLLETNVDSEEAEDGWELTPLGAEAIEEVPGPDDPALDALLGAAVAAMSPFPIQDHAATLVLEDQVFSNPANYAFYVREVVEGDPNAFIAGEAPLIRTQNDIETQNFGVRVPYMLEKDYRWISARGIEDAVIGRAWITEPGCSPNGENCLMQSWSIDLFYAQEDGRTLRFTSTWSQIDSPLNSVITEQVRVAALANGMHQVFESSDEWLEEGGLTE